MDELVHFGTAM